MEWTDDKVLELIEAYKNIPMLWNVRSTDFKIKTKKQQGWEDLATQFSTTAFEVKKKMESVLASFRRERNKTPYIFAEDGEVVILNKPKWFAFDSLVFLLDKFHAKQNPERVNMIQNVQEDQIQQSEPEETVSTPLSEKPYENNFCSIGLLNSLEEAQLEQPQPKGPKEEPPSCSPTPPPNKKQKLAEVVTLQGLPEALEVLQNLSRSLEPIRRDECSVYGEHVANKLRSYDSRVRSIVQQHINNVLFEADMGRCVDECSLPF